MDEKKTASVTVMTEKKKLPASKAAIVVRDYHNALSALFRSLLVEHQLTKEHFDRKIIEYVTAQEPNCPRTQAIIRKNVLKEMEGKEMNWKTFVRCLNVLGISEFDIKISA